MAADSTRPIESAAAAELQRLFDLQRKASRTEPPPAADLRKARLDALIGAIEGNEARIIAAISADFGHRASIETQIADTVISVAAARHQKRHLSAWMRPRPVATPMHMQPARSRLEPQPLGVIGIIAPWNYPFQLAMIPLVDWAGLLLDRPEFAAVRTRLTEAGVSLEALRRLYTELDPSNGAPVLPASSISVLAARYDQVTPEAPRLRWQRAWGIDRVCVLEQGHATMLLSGLLRPMAAGLLAADLKRLDQPRQEGGTPTGAPPLCAPY